MSVDPNLDERIAARAHQVVLERLRAAFAHQAAIRSPALDIDPGGLDRLVREAAARPGAALWRRSLAQAVMDEFGIGLGEALAHPALTGAPVPRAPLPPLATPSLTPPPTAPTTPTALPHEPPAAVELPPAPPRLLSDLDAQPAALRVEAIHLTGIESLRAGDRDIELRLSDAGLDVLKRSSGAAVGRLEWSEIETIELPPRHRGLRGRRRPRELHVSTDRGQAQFALPDLSESELTEQLEPLLARLHPGQAPDRAD